MGLNRPVNYAPKAKNHDLSLHVWRYEPLDAFDPKTSEVRGPMEQVKTKTDGLVLAETLPLLANHSDKIAVIRGLTSAKGRTKGNYFMHKLLRRAIVHPITWAPGLQDWMAGSTLPYLVPW